MRFFTLLALSASALGFLPGKPTVEVKDDLGEDVTENIRQRDGRIVGGTVATRNSSPHLVSLQAFVLFKGWQHFCAGSIIGDNKILTTAHCLKGYDGRWWLYRAVAGAHNIRRWEAGQQYRQFRQVVLHPTYNITDANDYDYAVIRTLKPFRLGGSTVGSLQLPMYAVTFPPIDNCSISGWGLSSYGEPSYTLQHLNVMTVDHTNCTDEYKPVAITDRMVCTKPTIGQGFCSGDIGGPLLCGNGNELLGLASWFGGKCGSDKPQVYAFVPVVVPWINSV